MQSSNSAERAERISMYGDTVDKMTHHFLTQGDSLSAEILQFMLARLANDAGGWVKHFIAAIENENSGIYQHIIKPAKNGLVLYGAGNIGRAFLSALQHKHVAVAAVIDTHKTGAVQGVPIITLADYKALYSVFPVVITPILFRREIAQILQENGISFVEIDPLDIADIALTPESMAQRQRSGGIPYMSLAEMPWRDDEVFVDCGVYDGVNTLDFIRTCREKGVTYHKIFGFEADPQNFALSWKNLSDIPRAYLFNQGVGCYNGEANIIMAGQGSTATQYGGVHIRITTLDEALKDERVTFIKMDIECGELAVRRCEAR